MDATQKCENRRTSENTLFSKIFIGKYLYKSEQETSAVRCSLLSETPGTMQKTHNKNNNKRSLTPEVSLQEKIEHHWASFLSVRVTALIAEEKKVWERILKISGENHLEGEKRFLDYAKLGQLIEDKTAGISQEFGPKKGASKGTEI